jgi:O-acetyl-ADP-ribose deacetylase (regulator of RNase III)
MMQMDQTESRPETDQVQIGKSTLALLQGNIVEQHVDALVNAANAGLRGGGGVDGAIHRAGGPSILEECRRIGSCPVGGAVLTGAGALPARYVIHAVAPIYRGGGQNEASLLRDAYRNSLLLADQHALRSIAFPALGTGAYGYPLDAAAEIALETMAAHLQGPTSLQWVAMVLFDPRALAVHRRALRRLLERPSS